MFRKKTKNRSEMGKKKERAVGAVLINDHRKAHKRRDPKKDSWLHTTEMDDLPYPGYDPKLDKLKSCTEQVRAEINTSGAL